MSRLKSTRVLYPDCLPIDEAITALSFDERHPGCLRIGGDQGSIA